MWKAPSLASKRNAAAALDHAPGMAQLKLNLSGRSGLRPGRQQTSGVIGSDVFGDTLLQAVSQSCGLDYMSMAARFLPKTSVKFHASTLLLNR